VLPAARIGVSPQAVLRLIACGGTWLRVRPIAKAS
jgi:hypothetical protein